MRPLIAKLKSTFNRHVSRDAVIAALQKCSRLALRRETVTLKDVLSKDDDKDATIDRVLQLVPIKLSDLYHRLFDDVDVMKGHQFRSF